MYVVDVVVYRLWGGFLFEGAHTLLRLLSKLPGNPNTFIHFRLFPCSENERIYKADPPPPN